MLVALSCRAAVGRGASSAGRGASVTEVASVVGVSRVSVHAWVRRYLVDGLPAFHGVKGASRRYAMTFGHP